MNFLSHFYFVQHCSNPYITLGSVLPDLFRNHRSDWKFNPEKIVDDFFSDDDLAALYKGWNLHIQIDALFHNSAPFKLQSSLLRKDLQKVFTQLPKRPFFLAHIGYELILDSLLLRKKHLESSLFYEHLRQSNDDVLKRFMLVLGITETDGFHAFLKHFINTRYLETYTETESLVHALDNIGRRVWIDRFTPSEFEGAVHIVESALDDLSPVFLEVFRFIEEEIADNPACI